MARPTRENEGGFGDKVAPAQGADFFGAVKRGMPVENPEAGNGSSDTTGSGDVLQSLLRTNVDSAHTFEEAAEQVSEQPLVQLFGDLARQRRKQAEELARYIGDAGGEPDAGGSLTGSMHRLWMKLKAAVSDDDACVILDEAERTEDHVKERYDEAMSTDLPADAQAMLSRHHQAVHAAHAKVRDLRDTYREQE